MAAILRNNAVMNPEVLHSQRLGRDSRSRGAVSRMPVGGAKRRLKPPEDPAAELMPAAEFLGIEKEFYAILEEFRDSPLDPARRRVLGRLMGVFAMDYQGARAEERRFLKTLLFSKNAKEAYAANRALHLCTTSPVIRRTLALAVGQSRFPNVLAGGFLSAVQARVAATMLRLLGPKSRECIWNLLTKTGKDDQGTVHRGAECGLERALILKALAARRYDLGPWSKKGEKALDAVRQFADEIRGASRECLAARTTLLPHDPERQAWRWKTLQNSVERAAFQARGDIDPIFAWIEHGSHQEHADTYVGSPPEAEELPDMDQSLLLDRTRIHWALAEAKQGLTTSIDPKQAEALSDYMVGRNLSAKSLQRKNEAQAILGNHGFDICRTDAIEAIRQDAQGTYRFNAAQALGDLISRFTGACYVRRLLSDQVTAGTNPVGQIQRALQNGFAVFLTVSELKFPISRAFAVSQVFEQAEQVIMLCLHEPYTDREIQIGAKELLAAVLPTEFGQHARADTYLAPAALDLMAPPFGIPFPTIGIEDRL